VPLDRSVVKDAAPIPARSRVQRILDVVLTTVPRRRIRLTQWLVAIAVYTGSVLVVGFALQHGLTSGISYFWWTLFLTLFMVGVYVAFRSGWSERFADPALTTAQILLGVVGVEWAYVICGPTRSMTLYPLVLIFAFGAFSRSWRRMIWLTLLTLGSLIVTVTLLTLSRPASLAPSLRASELHLDQANVLMISIVLPAVSVIAAQLSIIRRKLRSQHAALTEALGQVQRLATHDDLTGLVNRRYIEERLTQELHRFQRHGHAFSIVVIDLDFFKRINDTQGHAFGDKVLQDFANEAKATLRDSDLIARWGGEEFLVLLPDTRRPQGVIIIQRLLARMSSISHGTSPPLTFSAGITEAGWNETVVEAIARADAAMYEAKKSGRNTVRLAEPAAGLSDSSTS
jgi:diguanylate cyclase (GGDEF)-like protein